MKKYITTYQEYLDYWQKLRDKVPFNIVCEEIRCKFCFSRNIIKYGHFKTMQRWWCKDCQRKFADNGASPYMKTHNNLVSSALVLYYNGMSLNSIRKQLIKHYYSDFSASTIYNWIHKYTDDAMKNTRKHKPRVGDVWVAEEHMVSIDGKNYWITDIMDARTRYLLASSMHTGCANGESIITMEHAIQKADKVPRLLLTNGSDLFKEQFSISMDGSSHRLDIKQIANGTRNDLCERFHNTLQRRTRIMQSLKNSVNAELIMNGWLVHYNYFLVHEGLCNRTPSELAGMDQSLDEGWNLIVKHVRDIAKYWQNDVNMFINSTFTVPAGVYTGNTTKEF